MALKPDPVFPGTKQHLMLCQWAQLEGWTNGAEIGVLKGKTLFNLLDTCPDLHMIGVDQWLHLPPSGEPGSEHYRKFDMERIAQSVQAKADAYGPRCRIIRMDSVEAAGHIENGSLDFVFVDAAHTYPAVRADIMAWAPKVKETGYVCGHDWNWPSVERALNEVVPGWERHEENVWRIAKADL